MRVEDRCSLDSGDLTDLDSWFYPQSGSQPKMLLVAIVERAWLDLHRIDESEPLTRSEVVNLRSWLRGSFPSGMPYQALPGFSFVEICSELDLDADILRTAMLTIRPPSAAFMLLRPNNNPYQAPEVKKTLPSRRKFGREGSVAAA